MKVLFLIPKNNPPTLEGNYSKPLKEFVEACLNKEPSFVSAFFHLLRIHLTLSVFLLTPVTCSAHSPAFISTEADCQRAAEA